MSKKDEILNCCRDQARNAGEIASLLELDKTVVKITLLYCFKRGLVTREKRDRPVTGSRPQTRVLLPMSAIVIATKNGKCLPVSGGKHYVCICQTSLQSTFRDQA
jgi:hypothetical protein